MLRLFYVGTVEFVRQLSVPISQAHTYTVILSFITFGIVLFSCSVCNILVLVFSVVIPYFLYHRLQFSVRQVCNDATFWKATYRHHTELFLPLFVVVIFIKFS